jgi:hypothetical protein
MDDALCGGGDSGASISSTAVPLTAAAVNQVKAAIFMGDPRYVYGLPYNVGTCTTYGVSTFYYETFENVTDMLRDSSTPAPRASCAPMPARSSPTATQPIPTAAQETTPTCTKATAPSTASRRSLSSRPRSAALPEAAEAVRLPPPPLPLVQARHRRRRAAARHSGASVEARDGRAQLAALRARARPPMLGTRSA